MFLRTTDGFGKQKLFCVIIQGQPTNDLSEADARKHAERLVKEGAVKAELLEHIKQDDLRLVACCHRTQSGQINWEKLP